jgi:hypothetical protein
MANPTRYGYWTKGQSRRSGQQRRHFGCPQSNPVRKTVQVGQMALIDPKLSSSIEALNTIVVDDGLNFGYGL